VGEKLHAFLTSAQDGGEWSASRPGHFITEETDPDRKLDEPQSRFGRCNEKHILPCRELNPGSLDTILTEIKTNYLHSETSQVLGEG
jgi:hypothetical protein